MENTEKLKLARACKQRLHLIDHAQVVFEAALAVQDLVGLLGPHEMKKSFCGGDLMVLRGKPDVIRLTYRAPEQAPVSLIIFDDGRNVTIESSRRISIKLAKAAITSIRKAALAEAASPLDQLMEQGQSARLVS